MDKKDFEFPDIIKEAVKGLDNEMRWKILESLITNEGEMSYTQLMKRIGVQNKGLLTFHLRELSKSAIIERYERLGNKHGEKSFYDISSFGEDIINGLMMALTPRPKDITILEWNSMETTSGTAYGQVGYTIPIPYASRSTL